MLKKIFAWLNQAGNAKFGKLSVRDVVHGVFMAAGMAAGTQGYQMFVTGKPLDLHTLTTTAIAAGGAAAWYYIKQLLSNTSGTIGPEPKV